MQSADPTRSSAPTAPRAHRGDDSPPLRAERQLCTQRMLSARANAGNAHTPHTPCTRSAQPSDRAPSAVHHAARTPNSGDPRLQPWLAGSCPNRDPRPLNSLRSRALNSRARAWVCVCVYGRGNSHLADQLPAPVHAPRAWVAQEGGHKLAAPPPPGPGLHLRRLGLSAQRARGLRKPVLPAALPI